MKVLRARRARSPRAVHRRAAGALVAAALLAAAWVAPGASAAPAPAPGPEALAEAAAAVRAADVPGTAWAVDVAAGTVRVTVDDTVTAAEVAAIRREAGDLAGALAFDRTPGRLTPRVQGGESVWASGGSRCTLAFNVAAGATAYFLTAGHCLTGHPTWYTTQALTTVIGPTAGVSFPGNDYGIVRYANTAVPRPGTVLCNGQVVDITGWTVPIVGTTVWMAGATTGCHSGTITGLNHTVNWGGGSIVSGLIATNVCAEPGDSGAPLFTRSGSTGLAVGILSGGSGNCASGGTTYWQPIGEVLSAYGVGLL